MADQLSSPPTSSSPPASPSPADSPELPTQQQTQAPLQLPPRLNSMAATATTAGMTNSSTPLGNVNAARRPPPNMGRGGALNPDIAAKMKAFHLTRTGAAPPISRSQSGVPDSQGSGLQTPRARPVPPSPGPSMAGGIPSNFRLPPGMGRPTPHNFQSAPVVTGVKGTPGRGPSLAEKRGLKLGGGMTGQQPAPAGGPPAADRMRPKMTLSAMNASNGDTPSDGAQQPSKPMSELDRYAEYIDKETGSLKFKGKAVLTNKGVEFASGQTFNISLDEVDTLDELGKGNYGTVYKVRHARPQMRRPGQGLAGNKALPMARQEASANHADGSTSGIVMAMKELRLELDDAKFAAIIMELDILHRCISPFIVDFYGAFFQEGAVYICMEFMDGGSIDKIYGDGIPETVLRKITLNTTKGLKSLKDEHNIIHRDVKPTNILVNSLGGVKICDFGVSGNLVASIAKTNIGCQSYMAPERISGGGVAQAGANPGGGTYSVQSDIWSLGLTIIECALGRYPYPPETYDNIFSQLAAIVDGVPPDLPADKFSEAARNFVAGCLNKIPKLRPTYAMLLQHAWLAPLVKPDTITEEAEEEEESERAEVLAMNDQTEQSEQFIDRDVGMWVRQQLEKKRNGTLGKHRKPALHAAPLDATTTNSPGTAPVAV